jgi:hypothetical protein
MERVYLKAHYQIGMCTGATGGVKQTTCVLNHGLIVFLWKTRQTWDKEYNKCYSYRLLTTLKIACEFVNSELSMMVKVADTINMI